MEKALKRSLSVILAITIIFSSVYAGLGEVGFGNVFNFSSFKRLTVKSKAVNTSSLTFTLNDDCVSYSVTNCDVSASGEIAIPSTYNRIAVTSIDRYAFYKCSNLVSITIPDSVTSIEEYAFDGCTSLTSITIPDSVRSIGDYAFSGCSNLTSVYITSIFSWCNIDFKTDSSNPLYNAKNLYLNGELATEVVIPEGVTQIPEDAFYKYEKLHSITLPDSVRSIGDGAFYNCKNLESIIIPDTTVSIGNAAFLGCTNLASVTIGDSVTSIGERAFEDCKSLSTIIIPDSVTDIGIEAFYGCSNLITITIPDGVTSIGGDAFACTAYYSEDSNWENEVLYIGNHLIEAKTSLSGEYTIKDGTKTVASSAFKDCTDLTTAIILDGVTNIGSSAFWGCENLIALSFSDTIKSVGSNVLLDTAYYNDISNWVNEVLYVGNHLIQANNTLSGEYSIKEGTKTVAGYAFRGCKSLNSITIPDSVTSIGNGAFYNCTKLESVYTTDILAWCGISFGEDDANPLSYANNLYINGELAAEIIVPDGVVQIPAYGFSCESITSITIPDSVTSIGDWAFYCCTSLASITIPDSIKTIGECAFYGTSLSDVYITDVRAWCEIDFKDNHSNPLDDAKNLYINGELATEVIIPDGVKQIPMYGFSCENITSITIPNSVASIGYSAFKGCKNLESVYITDISAWCNISFGGVYSDVNPLCFANDLYLNGELVTEVVIPDGVKQIPTYGFSCENITSIIIPDSVTAIGGAAFSGCINLSSITIPDSVTAIGEAAFKGCTNISSITIPEGVISIGDDAFYDCASLTSIKIPEGVTSIGGESFSGCISLISITIPKNITSIGGYAFDDCKSLTSITIPDSVTYIDVSAFNNCTSLADVYITDLTAWCNIDFYNYASNPLYYAKNLYINGELATEIIIPDGVTSIGEYAFYDFSGLTSIAISCSVTAIGEAAFKGCTNLSSITIPKGVISIDDDAFFDCINLTNVYITDIASWCGIVFYGAYSNPLYYAENLYMNGELATDIVIPDSVTSVGKYAFYNCTSLTSITISDSVMNIGNDAFRKCTNLESVTIGDSVTSIGTWTFEGCTNLTSVVIGDSVTSIGSYVFYGCTSLESISIPDSVTSIGSDAFYGCTGLKSISIPDSVTSIGSYAFEKCASLTSIVIPNSVTKIDYAAFRDCTSLISVVVGEGVTSIGNYAFYKCTNLKSITIPNRVISIGNRAFSECASLKDIVIPDSVTSIGNYAFSNCTNLTSITIPDSVTSIGDNAIVSTATVYCYENSAAHDYAVNNSLDYVLINLHSVNNQVNIDYDNKFILSSADVCTDYADIISTSQSLVLDVEASSVVGNTKLYGTGSKVSVTSNGAVIDEYTITTTGDTNGDSVCDALDAWQVGLASNGHETLNGAYAMAADSNSDDVVDISDYQSIVNRVVA